MLSRVAESLYWTARYVERAEDVTRLLDVNFHALLDAQVEDRGQTWLQIVQLLGDEERYREHYDEATAINVSDWVLWHDGNPNAVANCITLARENARSVREQISGEMWEAINKLFLLVRGANRRAVSRGPHAFFEELRNGAHLFQGSADATMTHGDPYEFIRLGLQLERASKTVRIVASRYPIAVALDRADPARARQLIALLESCSAFEAYVKRHGTLFEPIPIAEELDPLGRLPARGAVLPRGQPRRRLADLERPGSASPDHRTPRRFARVRRGRRHLRRGSDPDAARAPDGDPRCRRGSHEGVLLEPRPPDRRARDAGGTATAMWLTVEHVTRFAYDASINEAYSEIRLKPAHRDGQRCSSFALGTEPRGVSISEYRDRFGNVVHHFDVLESHQNLVVTARSEVWTPEVFVDDEAAPSLLDRWDLLRESRYVPLEGSVAELAATIDSTEPSLETAHTLMTAVRGRMKYETGSTHVRTLADEALSAGHGVCQDFAHVLIGVCRLHGIPARYVSGYLYDPRASGNGNSASHAWVDVWEPGRGWVSLDPTHDREQTDRYVRVGVGRDYADVPPTRGVYKGKAKEELEVAVRIRELWSRGRVLARTALANGGDDRLEQRRRHGRERADRLDDLPERAVRLADLVRDRPDLDRRHPGEARGTEDAEALHRLDRDVATDAPDGRARPDRERRCAGQHTLRGGEQPRIGGRTVDQRDRCREIAVDSLGADHERPGREPTAARDADVQHGGGRPKRERAGRCGRRLDRPDPADEPIATVELALGRCDEEDAGHAPILCAPVPRPHSRKAHNRLTGAPQQRRVSSVP